jgi:mannose-1-phosphate guanylyltransferase
MKAVILAGGFGTRLRPLTLHTPKPLIPLLGKPLIMHIIDALPSQVNQVVLAVNYMREHIEEYFQTHDVGREVILVEEKEPLGTGGAIKNLSAYLDERFIAFNGDIVSSVDLDSLVSYHERCRGIGTLSLWRVDDPTAFGVVALDGDGRITQFQEKPSPEEACSDLINAGVYIFEPEILDWIGEGKVSIEREVFPNILDEELYGFKFHGYWVDCGTRENLLLAQRILLELSGDSTWDCEFNGGMEMVQPNHMTGTVMSNCRIGPFVYSENGVSVGSGSEVRSSILLQGAKVGHDALVVNSILGPGTQVEDGMRVVDTILIK